MRDTSVTGVRLVGVAAAVPDQSVATLDDAGVFGEIELEKVIRNTGIRKRRIAPPGICTSDLCFAAAERLLSEVEWPRESIDTLIFVTQTPDYIFPATSCSLHARLGLVTNCAAFDVNLGCSGYTYGLWLAAHLIASRAARRVLLLSGETGTSLVHPNDRSARPLFGDAGSATVLEASAQAPRMAFRVGTDGAGQNRLIVPAGGFRLRSSPATHEASVGEDGNTRSLDNLFMDGAEIFLFTLERVPPLIEATLGDMCWTVEDVDAFVFHQANRFMLEHLAATMKLPPEKLVLALEEFGNTSSGSIPLAMTACLSKRLRETSMRLILAGFGVGFSWSAVGLQTDTMIVPDLVVVDTRELLQRLADEQQSHLPPDIRRHIHAPAR